MRNREYDREYNRKWHSENKESVKTRHSNWRENNRENRNAYARAWHAKARAANLEQYTENTRRHRLKRRYGITPQDYDALLLKQGGHCALCDRTPDQERYGYLHVDHCHESLKVRGLLCEQHNLALGKMGDNEQSILRVLEYIRSGI